MAKTIRLSDREEEYLIKNLTKINKELVEMNMIPMKDTELFHEMFRIIFMKSEIKITNNGTLEIK